MSLDAIKAFEQLINDVAYLKEREQVLTHSVKVLMSMMPGDIKGYKDASTFLAVSVSTLEGLVRNKKIPYSKHGRSISFAMQDLLAYKESRLIKHSPSLPTSSKL